MLLDICSAVFFTTKVDTQREGRKRNTTDQLRKVKLKFALRLYSGEVTPAVSHYLGCPPLVKPKKKRLSKPPSKRRDTRCDVEEVVWEMPRSSVRKGWYTGISSTYR